MASKPTDLTSKTWNKLKGLTVPKTGFGEKLDAYQAAKKKTETLQTRTVAAFNAAADALEKITKHIPEAQKKCNKTLHKDTIDALAAYKPLIDKEAGELHTSFVKYQGYIDAWKHKREVGLKQLPLLLKHMTDRGMAHVAAIKKASQEGKLELIGRMRQDGLADLKKDYDACITSIETWRVPPPAVEQPHMDDRPDGPFSKLVSLAQDVNTAHSKLQAAIEMPSLPAKPQSK